VSECVCVCVCVCTLIHTCVCVLFNTHTLVYTHTRTLTDTSPKKAARYTMMPAIEAAKPCVCVCVCMCACVCVCMIPSFLQRFHLGFRVWFLGLGQAIKEAGLT
jgi:hypothetical protein